MLFKHIYRDWKIQPAEGQISMISGNPTSLNSFCIPNLALEYGMKQGKG